jgi:quinol monooxygenase YgiN
MTVYTSGDYHVKAGREDEFVALWRELTEMSLAEIEPDARALLMRDRENPRHFRSVGEFRNEEAIVSWRHGSVFGERIALLSEMLEELETSVFDVVESLGLEGLR